MEFQQKIIIEMVSEIINREMERLIKEMSGEKEKKEEKAREVIYVRRFSSREGDKSLKDDYFEIETGEGESIEHVGYELKEFLYYCCDKNDEEIKVYKKGFDCVMEYWINEKLEERYYVKPGREFDEAVRYFKGKMFNE